MSRCLVLGGVGGGGLVSGGGLVGRGGLVGGSRVLGVLGDTFVFDVGHEARVTVNLVGDDLSAAVGKSHTVRSGHGLAIAGFLVAEAVVRRSVFDGVSEVVRLGRLQFGIKRKCSFDPILW